MQNITNNISVLESEVGNMVVTEFVLGHRIYVDVTEKGIELRQDEQYNRKTYGKLLDLETLWKSLVRLYNIEEDRLFHAPIREYTLNCVFFDPHELMNKIPVYPSKGFMVVEVIPKNGIMINPSKIEDFCMQVRSPCVKPLFSGTIDNLRLALKEIRNLSHFALNKLNGGLVIKNDPIQTIGDKIKRWYIEPDYATVNLESAESPMDLASEFVRVIFTPQTVIELSDLTNVKPTAKKKFTGIMLNYLKEECGVDYDSYIHRCLPILGDQPTEKFDNFLREQALKYINDTILHMKQFSLQKEDVPKPKRGRKPKTNVPT